MRCFNYYTHSFHFIFNCYKERKTTIYKIYVGTMMSRTKWWDAHAQLTSSICFITYFKHVDICLNECYFIHDVSEMSAFKRVIDVKINIGPSYSTVYNRSIKFTNSTWLIYTVLFKNDISYLNQNYTVCNGIFLLKLYRVSRLKLPSRISRNRKG